MNALDLFAQAQALSKLATHAVPSGLIKPLHADRWNHVSVNGKQVARVVEHAVSFDAGKQLARFQWTFVDLRDDTNVQTIAATIDVHGRTTIALDADAQGPGDPVAEASPRIAARPIPTLAGLMISVELIFDLAGKRQDYRFDGRVYP